MENSNEKLENQSSETKSSGISPERLKALKGNYLEPVISKIEPALIDKDCSDMACITCGGGGCSSGYIYSS